MTSSTRLVACVAAVLASAIMGLSARQEGLSGVEAQVAAADRSWAEFYQACDIDGMTALIADDMVFIHLGGNVQDKAAFIDSVRLCNMESVTTTPASIRVYGDTALVVGNMAFAVEGMEPGALIYTRAYVKRGDRWRMVTHQSTATRPR